MSGARKNRSRRTLFAVGVGAAVLVAAVAAWFAFFPLQARLSSGVAAETVTVDIGELAGVSLVEVGRGCENLYLVPDSPRLYVTDLRGYVHLLDGLSREELGVAASRRLGREFAFGIDRGPDGYLYVAAPDGDWLREGGAIYRLDPELASCERITGNYPGLNGLAFDDRGHLYFAAGNLNPFNAKGAVYLLEARGEGRWAEPKVFLAERGSANGLYFDRRRRLLAFTETFRGVSAFRPRDYDVEAVVAKTKAVEGFDDLCRDREGNYWIADPGSAFVKRYDPTTKTLTRFVIEGCGQASSCRIRLEGGEEILYVTELRRKGGLWTAIAGDNDGRGVFAIPLAELRRAAAEAK
jgi:sugar lactone lactonase YvrE